MDFKSIIDDSRSVTSDQILFDEAIGVFRREYPDKLYTSQMYFKNTPNYSYILLPFELTQEWDLGICKVYPSKKVQLKGAYASFISKVDNPKGVGFNPHLFGIALATIISVITLKPCKSTRDRYLCKNELTEDEYTQLALLHPLLIAGPGAYIFNVTDSCQTDMQQEINKLISKMFEIDYKNYILIFQALRMVSLSINSLRDDFGLAYMLAVSSIEAIAQKAIKRDLVKEKDDLEKIWKEKTKDDVDLVELLNKYKKARGDNQYLAKRFIKFIKDYAPVEKWEEYVIHPMKETEDIFKEMGVKDSHLTEKMFYEKYPNDLTEIEIDNILNDCYTYRSKYVHRGEQPPHKNGTSSTERFFEIKRISGSYEIINDNECKVIEDKEIILPKYNLVIALAKNSIIEWTMKLEKQ